MTDMTKQTEALQLINEMVSPDDSLRMADGNNVIPRAVTAIRRLHEVNQAMLEALKSLDASYERLKPPGYPVTDCQKKARAAIAKGEQQ